MNRKLALAGMAVIACVFGNNAHADEESGPYLGAGFGWVKDEVAWFEDSGLGFKIYGGYEFNRYFAAELAYIDAGTLKDSIGGFDLKIESSGIVAAVLGKLPLSDSFSLFAKVGYSHYEETSTVSSGSFSYSSKNEADDPLYGIGAEFSLGERVKLRAEYEIVDIPDADFDIFTVGATFRF